MAAITTTRGLVDESDLHKTTGTIDDDVERTTWVEYCERACEGPAHTTGTGDAPGVFCARHIHRSVDMRLKKNVVADGIAAMLGS